MGDKMTVCTVIGFPAGHMTTETKEFETRNALENGAERDSYGDQYRMGQG